MRIKINYETTEVSFYRFVCNDPEIKSSYVGHTTNFRERKTSHKVACNNEHNRDYHIKIYQIIRDNGGWDNWRMIEIEKRLVKDKREAERIEQEWIEKMEADMNSHKAFNVETAKEIMHQYYIKNVDKYKEQHHQYYIENISKIKEQHHQYWLKNADKIYEKAKEKITCECGCTIRQDSLIKHKKSPKHAKLMETKIASIVKN